MNSQDGGGACRQAHSAYGGPRVIGADVEGDHLVSCTLSEMGAVFWVMLFCLRD